jgi:DNA-binding beta-propeller fold protein YncE
MSGLLRSLIAAGSLLAVSLVAQAETIYATSIEGSQLVKVDTVTDQVTVLTSTLGGADSLLFDTQGRIIYTDFSLGYLGRYDPATNTNAILVGGLQNPADLALRPGGGRVLVSDAGHNRILDVDLVTNSATIFASGQRPDGLAFDPSGRLFANLSGYFGGPSTFAELDPATGTILRSAMPGVFFDGLTYDSFSDKLYTAAFGTGQIYAIDLNTLAFTVLPNVVGLGLPDGITSNGKGQLFTASRSNYSIYEYDLTTETLAKRTTVYGLDDLAPTSGLGSLVDPVPEPTALLLASLGGFLALGYRCRRRVAI